MSAAAPRIVVLWADGRSANLGVRVLAEGAASIARQAFPGSTIELQDYRRNERGFAPTVPMIKRDLGRPNGPIKRWIRGFDLVVDTGAGDSFADIYGWRRIVLMLYVQLTARRVGVPVVLAPQTFGPFERGPLRLLARWALRSAAVVAPRDSASAAFVRSLARRTVVASTDVVFMLPAVPRSTEHDVLLNVSGLLWNSDSHGSKEAYRAAVLELVQGLQARGRTVTLLAHVLGNPTPDDDEAVIRPLGAELGVQVIVPSDLQDVRRAVAGARLVVGARMHACLNALSVGTPAIAWAYSRKFAPLLADVGWPYTLDIRTDASLAASTLALIDAHPETELQQQLDRVLGRVRRQAPALIAAIAAIRFGRSRRVRRRDKGDAQVAEMDFPAEA